MYSFTYEENADFGPRRPKPRDFQEEEKEVLF
jgi:hypothetical protein